MEQYKIFGLILGQFATLKKKIRADNEQLFIFSVTKLNIYFLNIVASSLKNCTIFFFAKK